MSAAKIRTVIVDDEPLARSNLLVLLRRDPEIEVVAQCGSGIEALDEIRKSKPDLVFLDVQMPECDGFDVLEQLGEDQPRAIVFVTAYDQYALRAFEVHAVDYLLKPFTADRLREALNRARARLTAKQPLPVSELTAAARQPGPASRGGARRAHAALRALRPTVAGNASVRDTARGVVPLRRC